MRSGGLAQPDSDGREPGNGTVITAKTKMVMSITFQGIPAADGVALGDIYIYDPAPLHTPRYTIVPEAVTAERERRHIDRLCKPVIILAHDLLPSDIAALDPALLAGVVTEQGGPTSHTALLARQMGIPAVVGVPGLLSSLRALEPPPQRVAIDGDIGTVEIDPDAARIADYEQARLCYREHQQDLQTYCSKPAVTTDGVVIEVSAHIGGPQDARGALAAGADSVGLFRTEGLFLDRAAPPTEEEQVQAYRAALDVFSG